MQLSALMLARHNKVPAIIVKGGNSSPFMIAGSAVITTGSPGLSSFACCRRGHVIEVDGRRTTIPCDKEQFGSVMVKMLQKRRQYHLGLDEMLDYRIWTAFTRYMLRGLPGSEDINVDSLFKCEFDSFVKFEYFFWAGF